MTVSTLVEPAFQSVPPYVQTLGPEVADLAEMAGFTPDPEQRLALDAIFGIGPDNKSAALEAAIVAARQNIKTGLFKQCCLGWLFITDERLVVWSAHEFGTTQEAFRDLTELIEGCDPLRRRVKTIHRGNGEEAIELLSGQRVKFKARTKTGGRGLSGGKIVLDEAFALQPSHIGSVFPLLSVQPDPQVLYGSSAGHAGSAVLRGIRTRGRSGLDPRLVYLEWCDDLGGDCATPDCQHLLTAVGCRLDDERRWYRANTQLGRRMSIEYVRAERRAMPAPEFARERLGWWEDPADGVENRLPMDAWLALADVASRVASLPSFSVDVTPDRGRASVGVAGARSDGLAHVEVVRNGPNGPWVVEVLDRATEKAGSRTVTLDAASPAGALIPELERRGMTVRAVSTRELGQACGALADTVAQSGLRHLDTPELNAALAGAATRDLGDGAWAWSRKSSTVDVSPLVAVTLALHGHAMKPTGGGWMVAL